MTPSRVLFVCTGNTCRSPLAEVLARSLSAEAGLGGVEFRSAGTDALPGAAASPGARKVAARHGLSLENHRARLLTPDLVDWAEVILCMDIPHLRKVRLLGGGAKSSLLGAFGLGEVGGSGPSIPDPFGGDEEVYEETFQVLERHVRQALKRLRGQADSL